MPNIPRTGAAGQLPFKGEKPPVGKQEHGEPSPPHGAAGGYEIPMGTHGAPPQMRPEGAGKTGLKNAALGG